MCSHSTVEQTQTARTTFDDAVEGYRQALDTYVKGDAKPIIEFTGGSVRGFEEVSRYSTPDLGYVVQIERTQAQLPGSTEIRPIALRVTMIFRRDGDTWKVAHRHADPSTTPRPISTTIET